MDELDEASNNLYRFLEVEYVKDSVLERINDLKKNNTAAADWLGACRDMVGIVNQQLSYKSRTSMADACKNLQGPYTGPYTDPYI